MEKCKGSALISVLFISAIVAIIATVFAVRVRNLIDFSSWGRQSSQMTLALQGVKFWGISELLQLPPTTAGVMLLAKNSRIGPIQYHSVTVKGTLVDQEGLFNINSLVEKSQAYRFVRLAKALGPTYSSQQLYLIADAIRTTLAMHQGPNANPQFFDVTELLTVPQLPTRLYQQLKPYVTALPGSTTSMINVNTASAPVLMAASNSLSLSQANAIVQCVRLSGAFSNLQAFNNRCLAPMKISTLPNTTVVSQYFMIIGQAKLAQQQSLLRVLMRVSLVTNQLKAVAVWQSIT